MMLIIAWFYYGVRVPEGCRNHVHTWIWLDFMVSGIASVKPVRTLYRIERLVRRVLCGGGFV